MKKFQVITNEKSVNFEFPTSLAELSKDYLMSIASEVKLADHHSLIALVYCEKLGEVILAGKQSRKSLEGKVIPIFVTRGTTDSDFISSIHCKDIVIIPSSQISLGYHVQVPSNKLSLNYFISLIDKDKTVFERYNRQFGSEQCYFVDFKIVPNVSIVGFYTDRDKIKSDVQYVAEETLED